MSPFILKSEPKTQNFGFQLLMDCLFSSTLRNSSITFSFSLILKLFYSVANVSDGLGGLKYLHKVMINNTSFASSCLSLQCLITACVSFYVMCTSFSFIYLFVLSSSLRIRNYLQFMRKETTMESNEGSTSQDFQEGRKIKCFKDTHREKAP